MGLVTLSERLSEGGTVSMEKPFRRGLRGFGRYSGLPELVGGLTYCAASY